MINLSKMVNTLVDSKKISNGFNNFFTNIGPKLAAKIQKNTAYNFTDFMDRRVDSSMFLFPVTDQDVKKIVFSFQSKKSVGVDDINMYTVKTIIDSILVPLTFICNLSFTSGVFPDAMKIAKILPLYKAVLR